MLGFEYQFVLNIPKFHNNVPYIICWSNIVELFGYRNFHFGSVLVMFSKLQSVSVNQISFG